MEYSLCINAQMMKATARDEYEAAWGAEPPAEPSVEERASWFSLLTFRWLSDTIVQASLGNLGRGIVYQVGRMDKPWNLGLGVYTSFRKELEERHRWDGFVGRKMRMKEDPSSRGTLKWVGYEKKAFGAPRLRAGVEWDVIPAKYGISPPPRTIEQGNENDEKMPLFRTTSSIEIREEDQAPIHDGTVCGEELFAAPSGAATCEAPSDLRFVALHLSELPHAAPPREPSLLRALFASSKMSSMAATIWLALYDIVVLVSPLLLEAFVSFLSQENPSSVIGIGIVAAFVVCSVVQIVSLQAFCRVVFRTGLDWKVSCMTLIYHRAINLSQKSLSAPDMSPGRILNMMSADVERINVAPLYLQYAWSSPLQIAVGLALLYRLVGWCAFGGVAVLAISIPLQALVARLSYVFQRRLLAAADRRIRSVNELITGIRVVKFMGWEQHFVAKIDELGVARRAVCTSCMSSGLCLHCLPAPRRPSSLLPFFSAISSPVTN